MDRPAAPDMVRPALAAFPFDDAGPARSLYAYAPVFRVRDRAGDWVVKRTGLVGSAGAAIAGWTRALRDDGIAVVTPSLRFAPNPRRLADGAEWGVHPYVDGVAYRASDAQLRAAGRLLAQIHGGAARATGGLRRIDAPPMRDAAWIAGHAERARAAMAAHGVDDAPLSQGLVRVVAPVPPLPLAGGCADFKAANLVFGRTVTLIDPDHAALMPRLYDLAIAVLLFHSDCASAPARLWTRREWTLFRDAYLSGIAPTEREAASWPAILAAAWRDQGIWLLGNFPEGWADARERRFLRSLAAIDPAMFPLSG